MGAYGLGGRLPIPRLDGALNYEMAISDSQYTG
jgi:hypothetical protein